MMKLPTLIGLALFVFAASTPASAGEESKTQPAIDAAKKWLELVDRSEHARSWDEAASLFRGALTKDSWVTAVSGVRSPLGKVVKRELKSASYSTSLPGAPDGEYVVIQFATSFENKKGAIETITPMRDKDGAWRVSGYFIK